MNFRSSEKPEIEKKATTKNNAPKNVGLCATCKHCEYCCLCKNKENKSHYCEEYEPVESVNPNLIKGKKLEKKVKLVESEKNYMGLCRNCEKRQNCTLPTSEGGVWHCEEYE